MVWEGDRDRLALGREAMVGEYWLKLKSGHGDNSLKLLSVRVEMQLLPTLQ